MGAHKSFGAVRALAGVDLAISTGELLGIVGPNGSGKTTLFNCISGFWRLTSGQIRLNGRDISGWPMYRIARSGVVRTFQQSMCFGSATVRENVSLAVAIRRSTTQHKAESGSAPIDRLVDLVGLTSRADTPSSVLSHGQLRRLGLALALAAEPSLLLLDEPAAGLSQAEAALLAKVLIGVRVTGVTVTVVDHDMGFLMPLVDRMVVLSAGHKLAEGSPGQVRKDPAVIDAYLGTGPGSTLGDLSAEDE